MCISSNWVNDAQDSIAVKKFRDFPNSLIPSVYFDKLVSNLEGGYIQLDESKTINGCNFCWIWMHQDFHIFIK